MAPRWRRRLRLLFRQQNLIALGVLALSLAVYGWVSTQAEINLLTPQGLKQEITNTGIWGVLVYIAVIALAIVSAPNRGPYIDFTITMEQGIDGVTHG